MRPISSPVSQLNVLRRYHWLSDVIGAALLGCLIRRLPGRADETEVWS